MQARIIAILLLCGPLWGAATTVSESLFSPIDGARFTGKIRIDAPVITYSGVTYRNWSATYTITSSTTFSVALQPNSSSTPYKFTYTPDRGSSWVEYCVVPASGTPVTLTSLGCTTTGAWTNVTVATTQLSGYIQAANFPALTGDVTNSAGSLATTVGKIQNRTVASTLPTDGQALVWSDSNSRWQPGTIASSGGTVTSVALTLPNIFSVSGSPVTTSGTLAASLATQAANRVWAGPSTGADATPTFRALVSADIPVNAAAFGRFIPYQSNPILSPTGGETLTAFGTTLKVGSTFYLYYMYNNGSNYVIGRATSSDGKSWTKDSGNNPVFNKGAGGTWDASAVGVPVVWKEGSTWHMLYRGTSGTGAERGGYATSTDGVTWTRAAVNNCAATSGNGCVLDLGLLSGGSDNIEFFGIIKVGSTYYAGIDNPGGASRAAGNATSTNLTTWTKDPANPTFSNGRYCRDIFKVGDYYYTLVNHYTAGGTTNADIEIYRDTAPTFYPADRVFLGILMPQSGPNGGWDAYALDTPQVLTDDISRSTYSLTGGDLWLYYSGTADAAHTNFYTGLAISARGTGWGANPNDGLFPYGITAYGNGIFSGDVKASGSNGFELTNTAGYFYVRTRSQLSSPANGNWLVQNAAGNDFGCLQLGGTTTSFGAVCRSGTGVAIKLADASADGPITASIATVTGNGAANTSALVGRGTLFSGGSATTTKPYWLLEPTGTTSTGWSTFGTALGINADSGFTGNLIDLQKNGASKFSVASNGQTTAGSFVSETNYTAAGGGLLIFTSRSKLGSDADGGFTLYNNALSGFTALNFGGVTSSFPAIKRSTTALHLRLANDSAFTDLALKELIVNTGTEGTCDSSNRGRVVFVAGGAGVADTWRICRKDAADAYAFTALY